VSWIDEFLLLPYPCPLPNLLYQQGFFLQIFYIFSTKNVKNRGENPSNKRFGQANRVATDSQKALNISRNHHFLLISQGAKISEEIAGSGT